MTQRSELAKLVLEIGRAKAFWSRPDLSDIDPDMARVISGLESARDGAVCRLSSDLRDWPRYTPRSDDEVEAAMAAEINAAIESGWETYRAHERAASDEVDSVDPDDHIDAQTGVVDERGLSLALGRYAAQTRRITEARAAFRRAIVRLETAVRPLVEAVQRDAKRAAELGAMAEAAILNGNRAKAIAALHEACAIERGWGDDEIWGRVLRIASAMGGSAQA